MINSKIITLYMPQDRQSTIVNWTHILLGLSHRLILLVHFHWDAYFSWRPWSYKVLSTYFISRSHNLSPLLFLHATIGTISVPKEIRHHFYPACRTCSEFEVFVCDGLLCSGCPVLLFMKSLKCWCKLRGCSWISTKDPGDKSPFQTSRESTAVRGSLNGV